MHALTPLNDNNPDAASVRPPLFRGIIRLALKGAALGTCVLITVIAIVVLVPEGNDYALALHLKHERLAQPFPKKIVLVGGSNLAFGVDSAIVERATGCPVVNMGMNGFFGVRYMLEEVKPFLNPSDIAVIAFEHDNFFKSTYGDAKNLLIVVKTDPKSISYLSWRERGQLFAALPEVAQRKVERVLYGLESRIRGFDPNADDELDMDDIETFAGFDEHGDLESHLKVAGPSRLGDGLDASHLPLETEAIALMRDFSSEMNERGVEVMVSYTSAIRSYYDKHKAALDSVHEHVLASPPLVAPSPPGAFVYERPLFFDTVYHLNAEGRRLRSEKLANDILRQFPGRARCDAAGAAGPSTL